MWDENRMVVPDALSSRMIFLNMNRLAGSSEAMGSSRTSTDGS